MHDVGIGSYVGLPVHKGLRLVPSGQYNYQAVVESTGARYWRADVLAGLGVALVLAHATRLKAICAAKVKTDQVDSDVLAVLLRAGLIPEAHMIRPEQRGPRDLMRTRLRLVEKCVSAQNSIDRLLEKFNVPDVGQLDALYQLQACCHQRHPVADPQS
ncbi:MAG: transposase [Gemmatimonadales bacterium]|nr:transposase [Gemmatimonadales bacterium]